MSGKMRISMTDQGDVVKGSIQITGDTTFVQTALSQVVVHVSQSFGVTPDVLLKDLWMVIQAGGAE